MITYWKNENGISSIDTVERNCWIDVNKPTPEEINLLTSKFKIPADYIQDILDIDERSRTEVDENWLLIILRIPIHHRHNGVPYITLPLGILISNNFIVTICSHENEIIPGIMHTSRKVDLSNKINFIVNIFLFSATWYLRFLKLINVETNIIEKDLEKSTKNKELHKLLKMEKCLVFFITSLKSNELLIAKLRNSKFVNDQDFDKDLLEDALIETKQAVEMALIYSDIQSGMMDAFASVISNNLNVIMKQLTSATIILMIPTLIASFFGMNVPSHIEKGSYSFIGIVFLSILLSLFSVYLFRKKQWF